MDFIKNKAKEFVKNYLKDKVSETDFSAIILDNVNPETQELIAEKVYNALLESLKNLDDETVARFAIQLKYKLLESAQSRDEFIKNVVKEVIRSVLTALEKDEEMRRRLNEKIREIILKSLEKY